MGLRSGGVALLVVLALTACTAEQPAPQPSPPTQSEPEGPFEAPSAAVGALDGADSGELEVDGPTNDEGQYLVRPGQTLQLSLAFRNYGKRAVETKIIIEALCQNAKFAETVSFRVPGSTLTPPESKVVATWHGTATIPADCDPLGIPGVADGSLNAEVRVAADGRERGESSTVTFSLAR
ncbi:hypothetical protein [Microlunatus sp. GCM10028923]|uniref:hypothetical protein n=1 Tax=Microlunatus sp. GCM10028923 TaxID=3273400 RepID=UPI003617273A